MNLLHKQSFNLKSTLLIILFLQSCSTYNSIPLDEEAVADRLQAPNYKKS